MSKRIKQFTEEQIELLLQNPNIEDVTANTIKFTAEFKEKALQLNSEGISPTQIFKDFGIDIHIIEEICPVIVLGIGNTHEKLKNTIHQNTLPIKPKRIKF